jgi:isopentenyldiphosphate isomerase
MQDEYHEVLDLVNANDEVVGTILRGEMTKTQYRKFGRYVRFVNGFVVNKSDRVWTQTRSLKKFIAPGGMDFSVAEHVLSGESYDDAIVRGFHEELGWKVAIANLTALGILRPANNKPVFDKIYALFDYAGPDPTLNRDEFVTGEWLAIDQVKKRLEDATGPQKKSLLPAIEMLVKAIESRSDHK